MKNHNHYNNAQYLSYRFNDASAYFHEDEREGLVRIARLALHQKYAKFNTDGYEAMYSRPPVIYISAAAKPGLGHYVCSQVNSTKHNY